MKILLINPPETSLKNNLTFIGLPLGLLYIAAILEKEGKQVKIFDSFIYNEKLIEKNIGDGMKHVGASWKRIKKVIEMNNPDIVGISNHFSSQIENSLKVAQIAKKINKKIKVILGGAHGSSNPQDFFKEKYVDFVIMGEGEFSFSKLIYELEREKLGKKARLNKINNLAYIKNKKIKVNPLKHISNLDELPLPAYHLINMENYLKLIRGGRGRITLETKNDERISMITSRGCPFNCIFCSIHGHMGRKWRAHSSEYVMKHILYLVKNYKINHISFEDDNLTLDIARFERILNGIIKNKIKISWDTPNGIRADTLNFRLLQKMKETGCSSLKIGIESGDQEVINKIVGKALDLKKVVRTASMCHKLDIPLTGFFVIGMPGETKKNIMKTINFAIMLKKKYDMDSVVHIAMPLIGTRMYEISKKKNYLVHDSNPSDFSGIQNLMIKTEEFDPEFLRKARKKYYDIYLKLQFGWLFKNPKKLLRYIMQIKNPQKFFKIFGFVIKYIKK